MDKKRTSKKKKIMGKLIQFPTNRIKRKNPIDEISEEAAKKIKETQFIDQLVESLTLDIIHVLQDNVVDMKANSFLRDLGITIECIKSLIKRDFGQHHPMHIITDSLLTIGKLPNGQKATNINYHKIFERAKKKAEEQTVEFEMDPDLKLD